MTTKNHTDLPLNSPGTSAVVNLPLGQLDSALADVEAQFGDFVASGGLPPTSVTLTLAQPACRAFVLNTYVSPLAQNLLMTATKDNYVDLDNVGVYHITPVTIGAAAPAIFANSIRLYKAVTSGTAVTSVVDLRRLISLLGLVPVTRVADYGAIGSGLDESAAINAAITAAGVNGRIGLDPGKTYVISASLTAWQNGQVLEGYGSIIKASADTFDMLTLGTATDITIRGVTFYGAATAENFTKAAITAGAGARLKFIECVFAGPNGTTSPIYGISLTGTTDVLIKACTFLNFVGTQTSIAINLAASAARIRILDNTFNFLTTAGRFMIVGRVSITDVLVMGNRFIGGAGGAGASGGDQVSFDNFTNTPSMSGIQIIGNHFRDYNGLSTEALEAAIEIGGNIIDTQIVGNVITNCGRHGIVVTEDGGVSACLRTQVIGNKVYKNKRHGILIRGTVDTYVGHNDVFDNSVETTNTYNGIMLSTDTSTACNRALLEGNHCHGTTDQKAGIFLDATALVPTGTVIIANLVPTNKTSSIVDNGTTTRLHGNSDGTANFGVGGVGPFSRPWHVIGAVGPMLRLDVPGTGHYVEAGLDSAATLNGFGIWRDGTQQLHVANRGISTEIAQDPVAGGARFDGGTGPLVWIGASGTGHRMELGVDSVAASNGLGVWRDGTQFVHMANGGISTDIAADPPVNGIKSAGPILAVKDIQRSKQTPSEAVLVSGVDAPTGENIVVTLTAARVVGAPLNPAIGQHLIFTLIQDGTGGRAVTWNAAFKVSWADTGNTLNKRSSIEFVYDGTSWNQVGAQAPYV